MTYFFIDEDFPCNQVEFEKRFNTNQACRDYLINMKWPDGFTVANAVITNTGSAQEDFTYVPVASHLIR